LKAYKQVSFFCISTHCKT